MDITTYNTAEFIQSTYWILVDQPVSVFALPVVYVPILILLALGVMQARKTESIFPWRFLVYAGVAALFPLSNAVLGVLFSETQIASVQIMSLGALLLLLGLLGWLLYREKGRRVLLLALGMVFVVWTATTLLIATMSISGTWI